ncbi:hypothetical protein Y032_0046g1298 [Ancylostoma ceylanicum]|nr:hypothetical protein Y032_0046g1298 [Ancylostoma ceylanicum]
MIYPALLRCIIFPQLNEFHLIFRFLPAFDVSVNDTYDPTMWYTSRVYDKEPASFEMKFQAALCDNVTNHEITISFFNKWIPPQLLKEKDRRETYFSFEKNGGEPSPFIRYPWIVAAMS